MYILAILGKIVSWPHPREKVKQICYRRNLLMSTNTTIKIFNMCDGCNNNYDRKTAHLHEKMQNSVTKRSILPPLISHAGKNGFHIWNQREKLHQKTNRAR